MAALKKIIIKLSTKHSFFPFLSILFFLTLLASRRWQQVVCPQIWCEDGPQVVYNFITHGWHAFIEPVNGYLITVPKIISFMSLGISFSCYPLISTIISWIFTAFVGLAIAISPTKIKGKFLCAVAVFIIPSDPEVFMLPLYTFWWASLLLFLIAMWDEEHSSVVWRSVFLLLGGLSSPVILLVLPVLYLRAYLYRSMRSEIILAFIATIITAIQSFFIIKASAGQFPPIKSIINNVIPTFFGNFLVGNLIPFKWPIWLAGVFLVVTFVLWIIRNKNDRQAWILLYFFIGSIMLTISRVDPSILHPKLAGPRYFYLPYIFIFWILIDYCYSINSKAGRSYVGIVAALAVINAIPVWSRKHDDLHWRYNVFTSRLFNEYKIPIMYDGNRASAWDMQLSGKTSASLLKSDLLVSQEEIDKFPTYPYAVIDLNNRNTGLDVKTSSVINSTMPGTDFYKSEIVGYRVIGSHNTSDENTGSISLKLRRGDHLLFRSGPSNSCKIIIVGHEKEFSQELPEVFPYRMCVTDWVLLDFSNQKLPDEFIVTINDQGKEWGEWCAIALKN